MAGDLNVESRPAHQFSSNYHKWLEFESALCSKSGGIHEIGLEFSRRAARLGDRNSLIDHVGSSNCLHVAAFGSHYGAPGDHSWVGFSFKTSLERIRFLPTQWRIKDWEPYKQDVSLTCPAQFENINDAEQWLAVKIRSHSDGKSRAQGRAEWEPFQIKALRAQIRACEDSNQQHDLSTRLHQLRREFAKSRRRAQSKAEARARNLRSRRQQNLHPVRLLQVDGSLTFDHTAWATGAINEFENKRWSAADTRENSVFDAMEGNADGQLVLDVDMVDMAAHRVKRPMTLDHRGVCVQAVRDCPNVQKELLKPLQALLNTDAAWEGRSEQGFIKGKMKETRHLKDC